MHQTTRKIARKTGIHHLCALLASCTRRAIADKVKEHDVNFHAYVDDTLHCHRDDTTAVVQRFERCITKIGVWVTQIER